jgi:hypothetical protein
MQPIDPNTLFSIFEQGDEQIYKEHGVEEVLNNPFVLMGTILNGMENYHLMDILYTKKYKENYEVVKNQVKFKYFLRMFNYLCRLDSEKFDEKYKISKAFDINAVLSALTTLLKYFEHIEHYEKCITVKNYIDLLIDRVFEYEKPFGYDWK